ncbi:MAG: hypothetical protein Q7J25_10425 [Vicinamibacterales bacterium]|nr:hypothetical protein [Vicinamibacterales bacterium]
MRSTENPADAGAVFDGHVVPAAAARRARHAPGLPLAPDPAASSYFTTRNRRTLTSADFEWPAVSSAEELRDRLRALWAGDPELLGLIEPLLSLVRIPKAGAAPGGDVPDHIYPMY